MDHNNLIGRDEQAGAEKEDKKAMMGCLAALGLLIVVLPLTIVLSTLWEGYVLSILWGWFIAGEWFAAGLVIKPLTVVQAFGLAMTVKLFATGFKTEENLKRWKEKREKGEEGDLAEQAKEFLASMFILLAGGLFVLGFGYVIHLFC